MAFKVVGLLVLICPESKSTGAALSPRQRGETRAPQSQTCFARPQLQASRGRPGWYAAASVRSGWAEMLLQHHHECPPREETPRPPPHPRVALLRVFRPPPPLVPDLLLLQLRSPSKAMVARGRLEQAGVLSASQLMDIGPLESLAFCI